MKKILVVLAAAVLVLSFAGAAFAIHAEIPAETQAIVAKGSTQLTLGGELRTRAWWRDNIAGGIGQDIGSQGWYDQRIRLTLDAQVSPNVKGRRRQSHITSRGPGTAMDFALTLVGRLVGKAKRREVEAGLRR